MSHDERRKLIRIEFIKRGTYLRDIARKLGVSDALVYMVVSGERTNTAVRQAIASQIGIAFDELWQPDEPRGRAA